jgi:hypothetical protein
MSVFNRMHRGGGCGMVIAGYDYGERGGPFLVTVGVNDTTVMKAIRAMHRRCILTDKAHSRANAPRKS